MLEGFVHLCTFTLQTQTTNLGQMQNPLLSICESNPFTMHLSSQISKFSKLNLSIIIENIIKWSIPKDLKSPQPLGGVLT